MRKKIIYFLCTLVCIANHSCSFLDVVPDNVESIETLFNTEEGAWQMLQTCYDYVPKPANICENPALLCGDEVVNPIYADASFYYYRNKSTDYIARGQQSSQLPLLDYWDGANYDYLDQVWGNTNQTGDIKSLWAGIRQCNILIENIDDVPAMLESDKKQWKAECYVLKAYYHYYLLQLYGPIPYMNENIDVSASTDETQTEREPVDDVVAKIVADLDIAINSGGLTATVADRNNNLGRINLPVAKAIKAKVLVLAASPIFNGNTKYPNYTTLDGTPLFNTEYSEDKWSIAADACIEAIDAAAVAGMMFYTFDAELNGLYVDPRTQLELNLRTQITEDKNNTELVWGVGRQHVQQLIQHSGAPIYSLQSYTYPGYFNNIFGATMNTVDDFYTKNGVPIDEDNTYDYANRFELTTVPEGEELYFSDEEDIQVPIYNTSREPRFYAYLGFDQGRYYNKEIADDTKSYVLKCKANDFAGYNRFLLYSPTGYTCKKLTPWDRVVSDATGDLTGNVLYFFPIIRLTDLYLMCAESLNEAGRDKTEVLKYLQPVRTKAGLDIETGGIEATWAKYSIYPTKLSTKEGMRDIIRQERRVELAFEGQRYWDIRRWLDADTYFNKPIRGWYAKGADEIDYYRETTIEYRSFATKNYFWPIKQTSVDINAKLTQSPGW